MPYFPAQARPVAPPAQLPRMIPIEGGIGAIGSFRNNQRFNDCPPRLVKVDSFSAAETVVTVGFQREVMGKVDDKAPDNFPAVFSHRQFEAFAAEVSRQTGMLYGIPTEAEWEYAARNKIDNVREFMDQQGLKDIAALRAWLIDGNGYLENFVVLGKGESLTLGARLLTNPEDSEFQATLENAHLISCWAAYGTESGSLNHEEAYYGQSGRGPVRFGKPNQNGLYDIVGGMWEHCADVYKKDAYKRLLQENPYNAPKSKKDQSNRVLRGGSWGVSLPGYLRAACRDIGAPPGPAMPAAISGAGCSGPPRTHEVDVNSYTLSFCLGRVTDW